MLPCRALVSCCLMVQRFPQVRADYTLIPIAAKPLARSRHIRVVSFCRQIQVDYYRDNWCSGTGPRRACVLLLASNWPWPRQRIRLRSIGHHTPRPVATAAGRNVAAAADLAHISFTKLPPEVFRPVMAVPVP